MPKGNMRRTKKHEYGVAVFEGRGWGFHEITDTEREAKEIAEKLIAEDPSLAQVFVVKFLYQRFLYQRGGIA